MGIACSGLWAPGLYSDQSPDLLQPTTAARQPHGLEISVVILGEVQSCQVIHKFICMSLIYVLFCIIYFLYLNKSPHTCPWS